MRRRWRSLLRADLVPPAYIPPRDVRDTREILRYRASLVRLRTQVKNKIAAIVSKTGLQPPMRTTCGVKSQRFLTTVPVRPYDRLELDGYKSRFLSEDYVKKLQLLCEHRNQVQHPEDNPPYNDICLDELLQEVWFNNWIVGFLGALNGKQAD